MIRLVFGSCIVVLFFNELCNGSETEIEEMYGDEGNNLTLPCKRSNDDDGTSEVMWRWSNQGKNTMNGERTTVKKDDSLTLIGLSRDEADVYTCTQEDGKIINRVRVRVRTPPPPLSNVTVVPSTIFALLRWEVQNTGGYPITSFTAQYRLKHSLPDQLPDPWRIAVSNLNNPTSDQIDVYQLEPNSTYVFQIWATNRLGRGEVTEVEAQTKCDIQEIELAKHLLEGAETFDTRVWVAAVAVVMGTLLVLATATIYALYKDCRIPLNSVSDKDVEAMELIPNIITNPGYQEFAQTEWNEPDENSNDTTAIIRLNNNTVIHPIRM